MGLEKRFAIVVGSNCYKDNKLRFTTKDAQDMSDILQKRCEFDADNIVCIKLEYPSSNNIKEVILQAFEAIKNGKGIKNTDTFLFYYSGHGVYTKSEKKSYLEISDFEKMAIQEIYDEIYKLKVKNNYLIIDACYAGGKLDLIPSKSKSSKLSHRSKGIQCLFASEATKPIPDTSEAVSIKYNIQNSYLTHYLIEVIETPERYTEGILGFFNIQEYVSIKSQLITNFSQIPVLQSEKTAGVHPFAIWREAGEIVKNKKLSPKPPIDKNYIQRKEETILIEKLEKDNVLLLTGNSECGKSEISKAISIFFWEKGYIFKITHDYAEATRFFYESNDNRICLLEDPFGHVVSDKNANNLHKIQDLVNNIPQNGKLIICSRNEVLKNIYNSDFITEWDIEGHEWTELTVYDRELLVNVWKTYCKEVHLAEEIQKQIETFLAEADKDSLLQIGQLRHLSKVSSEKLKNQNINYLCHLARADANELAKELVPRGLDAWKLCTVLTLSSNTITSVNLEDLNYILSDSNDLYGFSAPPELFRISSWGNEETEPPFIPNYLQNWELADNLQVELDFLEERGYIKISENTIAFSHPHYKEMANYVLFTLKWSKQKELIHQYILKTLATCNPQVAFLCAKQLPFIYDNFKLKNEKFIDKMYDSAIGAITRSYYPSVRDQCATFLINRIIKLDYEQTRLIFNYLKKPIEDDNIIFKDGMAIISENTHTNYFAKIRQRQDARKSNYDTTFFKKIENNEKVEVEELWKALLTTKYKEISHSAATIYLKAINANEVFIRTEAAFSIMRNAHVIQDWSLIKNVFNDEHPAVVCEGIKGAFVSFSQYSPDFKNKTLNLLRDALKIESVIIRANTFMMTFATDYSGENQTFWGYVKDKDRNAVWELWGELFPVFLQNYPSELSTPNSGRYSNTLDKAVEYVSEGTCFKIAEATLVWLNNQIKLQPFDTHVMSLIDFLLKFSTNNKERRFPVFQGIFEIKDTFFTLFNLSWCISSWKELTDTEKNILLNILQENRIDKQWIRAMSCVQYAPPKQIQQILFNNPTFFSQEPKVIVENMDNYLLHDCLIIFIGKQNFWNIGHKGKNIWLPIIKYILVSQHSFCFDICLGEFLFQAINGFNEDWKKDGLDIWKHLCENISSKKILAEALIAQIAVCSYHICWTQKLWRILLQAYKEDDNEDEVISIIADNLEAFSATTDEKDIFDVFDSETINKIGNKLPIDSQVLRVLTILKNRKQEEIEPYLELVETLLQLCKVIPLKFWVTFKLIEKAISEWHIEEPIASQLRSIPNVIQNRAEEIKEESHKKIDGKPLENIVLYAMLR